VTTQLSTGSHQCTGSSTRSRSKSESGACRASGSANHAATAREPQTVQVSELVEDLLALVNYRLVMQKTTVQTSVSKTFRCYGIPSELGRALLFILDNALEAMSDLPNPSLTIVAEESAPHCCIHIVDNGRGVRQELHDRVFEPFFTTKPAGMGTGLGLPVTKQIVELHGGIIDIKPRKAGGVRVTLVLKAETK
jgi:C4-dicarboxylate-specific signal transduction histidine kinase